MSSAAPTSKLAGRLSAAAARRRVDIQDRPGSAARSALEAMSISIPATAPARQLLAAVAARDPRLSSLLTRANKTDLCCAPMSLFHAAAAAGDAEAVRLLAEAGAPPAAAEQLADPTAEQLAVLGLGPPVKWTREAPALAIAIRNGHTGVVAALLAAEVSPHIGGQFAPLALALGAPAATVEPIAQLLLQAGADVSDCSPWQLLAAARTSRSLARLLMGAVQHTHRSWPLHLPTTVYGADEKYLMMAAALTDQPSVLERVCAAVWPGHRTLEAARQLLCSAEEHGCMQVLQLALQPASAGGRYLAAAAWLGSVPAAAADIMREAARADRPAALRLLMQAGYPASNEAIAMAVRHLSAAALDALLADGAPELSTAWKHLEAGMLLLPSVGRCPYNCPVLATLHARITQASARQAEAVGGVV